MRFTLSSTALSNKLSALSKVINSKNALPILGDFVFDIQGMTLTLTASDSENTMRTSIELTDSTGDGRFAIGNHDLLEAVKGFSEQPITFDANQEQNIVKISYQNGLFSLPISHIIFVQTYSVPSVSFAHMLMFLPFLSFLVSLMTPLNSSGLRL